MRSDAQLCPGLPGHKIIQLLQVPYGIPRQNDNRLSLPVPNHPTRDNLAACLHLDRVPVFHNKLIRTRLGRKDNKLLWMLRNIAPQTLLHRSRIIHRCWLNDRLRSQRVCPTQRYNRCLGRQTNQQRNYTQSNSGPMNSHPIRISKLRPRSHPPNGASAIVQQSPSTKASPPGEHLWQA